MSQLLPLLLLLLLLHMAIHFLHTPITLRSRCLSFATRQWSCTTRGKCNGITPFPGGNLCLVHLRVA